MNYYFLNISTFWSLLARNLHLLNISSALLLLCDWKKMKKEWLVFWLQGRRKCRVKLSAFAYQEEKKLREEVIFRCIRWRGIMARNEVDRCLLFGELLQCFHGSFRNLSSAKSICIYKNSKFSKIPLRSPRISNATLLIVRTASLYIPFIHSMPIAHTCYLEIFFGNFSSSVFLFITWCRDNASLVYMCKHGHAW